MSEFMAWCQKMRLMTHSFELLTVRDQGSDLLLGVHVEGGY